MCLVAKLKNNITLQLAQTIQMINIRIFSMEGWLFRMDGYAQRRFAHLVIELMCLVAKLKNNITLQLAQTIQMINIRNFSQNSRPRQ